MVTIPAWHLAVSIITLIILWVAAPAPIKTLVFILGLVAFLAVLQILFSPYMRAIFLKSLEEGFFWSDWQYLLFAVERFAWPLVIVSTFQSKLTNPAMIAHLTSLLSPLKWLGIRIDKLQVLIMLALRFLPSLQREWNRFSHFQNYFVTHLPRRTLIQKLNYWQGVFKAMIAHTIQRAVSTGDMLALRGLPGRSTISSDRHFIKPAIIWLCMGLLCSLLDMRILYLWAGLSVWLGLVAGSANQEYDL